MNAYTDQINAVDNLLTLTTETHTDMGADDWEPQIYFGHTDPDSGLREHRAGIDGNTPGALWWLDLDHGTTTITSPYDAGAEPAAIATWIISTLAETEHTR